MTEIILDEKAYVEDALKNLSLGVKPTETLGRVARYYYSQGYSKKEIGGLLEDFMIKCDPTINIVKWQNTIDMVVKSADKYKLIDISGVVITESEMDAIKRVEGKLLQRLMFTMLCLAKYGNARSETNNNWINRRDKDIFSLANIAVASKRQSLMINDLWNLEYIGYSRVIDNVNMNVKIVDDDSPTVMVIHDFRNLGYQYMRYCGEPCVECQCCGKVEKMSHSKQKYCKECAVIANRKKSAERYHTKLSS